MKRLHYNITIQSTAARIYDVMLGLSTKSTYVEWTSIFSPTSSYQGTWDVGSKILFVSKDDKGELAGMVSRILENRKNEFVSIQHNGMLMGGQEIMEGPDVEAWAGCLENYSFKQANGSTIVSIDIDTLEGHEEYMDKLYPKALEKLKEVCERG